METEVGAVVSNVTEVFKKSKIFFPKSDQWIQKESKR